MKQKLRLWIAVLLAACVPSAFGGIADLGTLLQSDLNKPFGDILVTSRVYSFGDQYLYTYQLDNPSNSTQTTSWFSVAVNPDADILTVAYDAGANVPALWTGVGSPFISVDAFFVNPISPGKTSTTLYYLSSVSYGWADASIGNGGFTAYNQVLAPAPEPMTLVLLGAGAVMSLRRRRHRV